ncbi:MAG: DNA-processing protein DprA [Ilumatobacteraceae bacterium]
MSSSTLGSPLPEAAYVAALAGLDQMGPARLRQLLAHHPPDEALAVLAGKHPPHPTVERLVTGRLGETFRAAVASAEPHETWQRCIEAGVDIVPYGSERFPTILRHDPEPPGVLFVRGDLGVLEQRRVGVIGTRNATRGGIETATALGADLAASEIAVVSGLARGIDGAAHRGALRAGGLPVAVVGNGPDRPYPREHTALWDEVARRGVLLSEWPPGVRPDAFRFPMRNRILAALAEVLVVVESRERGGSLLTVREAAERSVTVMAVPGSPRSRASAGTNRLLCDGAAPVTGSDDVFVALGLDTRRRAAASFDPRPTPRGREAEVLARCRRDPCTLDHVVGDLDISLAEAAMALARLERSGWVVESAGWFEVLSPWSGVS